MKAKSVANPGSLTTGDIAQFRILKSGRNNQLNQKAVSIVYHNKNQGGVNMHAYQIAEDARYDDSNPFVAALNEQVNSGASEFTMAGPYSGMNMSAYQDRAPCCDIDWSNASITNVKFELTDDGSQVSLYLIQFDIDCGLSTSCENQSITIKN
jgi:hypothetical protein